MDTGNGARRARVLSAPATASRPEHGDRGAVSDQRCTHARLGCRHHARLAVYPLFAAGPEGQAARSHLGSRHRQPYRIADQEQGFFSIPVDNINARVVHAEYFRKKFHNDFSTVVVVAPDFGGAVRARRFATRLGEHVPVSIIDKRRPGPNEVEVIGFVGEGVAGRDVILYDDMIDTGGTIRAAAGEIRRLGARSVCVCATHALFSAGADAEFKKAGFQVAVTPSIPRPEAYWEAHASWLECVSIDELLTSAIHQASLVGGSISELSA